MNKIYRKVWNRSLGHWVVASELASGDSAGVATAGQGVRRNLLAACVLGLLGVSGGAWAADAVCYDPVTGLPVGTASGTGNEVACGDGAVASGMNSLAAGTNASAVGENTVAIGNGATAGDGVNPWAGAIAVGNNAIASHQSTVAVGDGATASNLAAVAVGRGALAGGGNSTAIGDNAAAPGFGGTAIGFESDAIGNYSAAFGGGAQAAGGHGTAVGNGAAASGEWATAVGAWSQAQGDNSVALGAAGDGDQPTVAIADSSVALGASSIADTAAGMAGYDPVTGLPSTDLSPTWVSTRGAVSVGDAANGITRQITGVAAGTELTDAVNVAQLQAAQAEATTHYYSVNDNGVVQGNYNNDGATGPDSLAAGANAAAGGSGAIAIGRSNAAGARAIAMGWNASAQEVQAIAIGTDAAALTSNATALGAGALVSASASDSTALGTGSKVTGARSVAVGSSSVSAGQSSAMGYRNNVDNTGSDGAAFGSFNTVSGTGRGTLALGFANTASADAATAVGQRNVASGTRSVALGYGNMAAGDNSISIGTGNTVNGDNSGAIGDPSTIDGANSYSVGNNNTLGAAASNTFVLGNNVNVNVANATALGDATSVTVADGVALGSKSVASTDKGVAGFDPATGLASTDTSATWKSTLGAVSVGGNGQTRQITNVAAGTQATDAVNVAQLQAAQAEATTHYYSVNDNGVVQGNYNNDGATGVNSLAAGVNASAQTAGSVAVGNGATVGGTLASGSIAIGQGATVSGTVSTGQTTPSTGFSSIAIGNNAQSHDAQEVIIGTNAGLNAVMLGDPGFLSDSVMVGASAGANSQYQYATFIGQEAGRSSNGKHNTAVGQNAMRFMTGSDNTALGSNALASANAAGLNPASGSNNTGIGSAAGGGLQGDRNSYVGYGAGWRTVGSFNVATGASAGGSVKGNYNTATGANAGGSVEGNYNVANGYLAGLNVTGSNNIADGYLAGFNITANDTVAMGTQALASQDRAIAIGTGAQALGVQSISIGTGNVVSGANSAAIGDPNTVSGTGSYVLGNNNTVATNDTFVIGSNVTQTLDNSVALGANTAMEGALTAETAGLTAYNSATINGVTYNYAGGTPVGVVSVGAPGAERRIQNVAAGLISATSTDAINGSQLYAGLAGAQTHYYSVNDNGTIQPNYNNDGATGANSLAAGAGTAATATDAVAVGGGAKAANDQDVSIGAYAGFEDAGNAPGDNTAVGFEAGLGSVGSANTAIGAQALRGITGDRNIGLGTNAGAFTTGMENTWIGGNAGEGAQGDYNIAIGTAAGQSIVANETVSLGHRASAQVDDAVALGSYSVSSTAAGVAGYDPITGLPSTDTSPTWVSTRAAVSVGDVANGITRQITSVAAGTQDTDAVNVAQLKQVATVAGAGWNISAEGANTTNVAVGSATGTAVDLNNSDGNIVVGKSTASNDVTFDLADDITVNSVALGTTILNANGLTIAGGPSITNLGIDAGGLTITNVAPGVNGTDAVNVDQLNNIISGVSQSHYYSVNDGGIPQGNYANDGATGTNAMAAGPNATASAANGVALGNGASASTDNSVALGAGSTTGAVVGTASGTIAGTTYAYAGGAPAGTVSVGSAGAERTITHVAAGRVSADSTDAVNGSQLYATHQAIEAVDQRVTNIEGDIVDLGDRVTNVEGDVANLTTTVNQFDNRISNVENGADGMFQVSQEGPIAKPAPTGTNSAAGGNGAAASGANALAVGNQSTASGDNSTAIGQGATASHDNSVALGQGSATTVGAQQNYDAAYVGNSSSTGEVNVGGRTISGVAPGVAGTDAVNVDQLNSGVNYAITTANQYTDTVFNNFAGDVWHRIDGLERDINSGIATAMSLKQAPYVAGKTTYYAGVGAYKGQGAVGISLRRTADNGRWSLEGGFSTNHDGSGVYVGISGVLGGD